MKGNSQHRIPSPVNKLPPLQGETENNLISLLNFDPNCKSDFFLTSPRSKEACESQGILEKELLIRERNDIAKEPIPKQFARDVEAYIDAKTAYYEQERQHKLQILLKAREALIDHENKKNGNLSLLHRSQSSRSIRPSHSEASFFESGKKKLEVFRRRQELEIKLIIETEQKQQESSEKMAAKMRKIEEMQEAKRKEMDQKRLEAELAMIRRGMMKEEEQNRFNKQFQEYLEYKRKKEEKFRQKQLYLDQKREEEAVQRENKRRVKSETLFRRMKEFESKRAEEIQERREKMEEKQKLFEELSELKRQEQMFTSIKKREQFEERLHAVLGTQEEIMKQRAYKIDEKMVHVQEQLEKFQQKQKEEQNRKIERNMARSLEIKRMVELKEREQREKEAKIAEAALRAEIGHQKVLQELELARKVKKDREKSHENSVKQRHAKDMILFEQRLASKLEEINRSLYQASERKEEMLKTASQRKFVEYFREEEAKLAKERNQRVLQYRTKKLLERQELEQQRIEEKIREKEAIQREKERMKIEFEREKAVLAQSFTKGTKHVMRSASVGNQRPTTSSVELNPVNLTARGERKTDTPEAKSAVVKKDIFYRPTTNSRSGSTHPGRMRLAITPTPMTGNILRFTPSTQKHNKTTLPLEISVNESSMKVPERESTGAQNKKALLTLFSVRRDDIPLVGLSKLKWSGRVRNDHLKALSDLLESEQALFYKTQNEMVFQQSMKKICALVKQQDGQWQNELDKADPFQFRDGLSKVIIQRKH